MGQLLPAGALVLRLAGSLLGWQEDTTSFFKKIFVKSYLQQIEAWVCLTPPPGSAHFSVYQPHTAQGGVCQCSPSEFYFWKHSEKSSCSLGPGGSVSLRRGGLTLSFRKDRT